MINEPFKTLQSTLARKLYFADLTLATDDDVKTTTTPLYQSLFCNIQDNSYVL